MPVTFRTFFQGLAEAAPGIVNTIYQYRQDEINRIYQERQMSLEEQKAGVYGEYMGAAAERERAGTEELRATLNSKILTADATASTATLLLRQKQQEDNAVTEKYGPNGWGVKAEEEWDLGKREALAKITQAEVATEASLMQTKSWKQEIELKKDAAETEKAKASLLFYDTYRVLAKSTPEAHAFMDKLWKDNVSADGRKTDINGIIAGLRQNGDKYWTPEQMQSMLGSTQFLKVVEQKTILDRSEFVMGLTNASFSKDKGEREAALDIAGIPDEKKSMAHQKDPNDPRKRTFFEIAVEETAYRKYPVGAIGIGTAYDEVNTREFRGIPAVAPMDTTTVPFQKPVEKKPWGIGGKIKGAAKSLYDAIPTFGQDDFLNTPVSKSLYDSTGVRK